MNLDATTLSKEDSEEEDYHMVTGANRSLHGQSFQNPQSLKEKPSQKIEKFEYFGDLLHTTLRMLPNLTLGLKISHFHAHLRCLAL